MVKNLARVYDRMIKDLQSRSGQDGYLDTCASFDMEAIQYVPLRYRIIGQGFVERLTLDQLNEKLASEGCPGLYSRSFWEATLIFAFLHGLSYQEWKEIQKQCSGIYALVGGSAWFQESKITLNQLENYVQENSSPEGKILVTESQTQYLEMALRQVGDAQDLQRFLLANIQSFSSVREKTRYYFCKYLTYWINRRVERYFTACVRNQGIDDALSELLCLKVVTALRRKKTMPVEEKRALIQGSFISCSEIFNSFNSFFFEYVSTDWVESLLTCYEGIREFPPRHKAAIAGVLRTAHPDWKEKTDDALIKRAIREREAALERAGSRNRTHSVGKNREGENAVYRYIRGSLDIDRTVLICFLLFFASDAKMPDAHKLNLDRLQHILAQCGYPRLDIEKDFDWFVAEYLESPEPRAFLNEIMQDYADAHQNSFLYHVYGDAVKYEEELTRLLSGH